MCTGSTSAMQRPIRAGHAAPTSLVQYAGEFLDVGHVQADHRFAEDVAGRAFTFVPYHWQNSRTAYRVPPLPLIPPRSRETRGSFLPGQMTCPEPKIEDWRGLQGGFIWCRFELRRPRIA